MRLLFIAMNWLLQGVPATRWWTNPNYTKYDACYGIESDLKHESNAECVALI